MKKYIFLLLILTSCKPIFVITLSDIISIGFVIIVVIMLIVLGIMAYLIDLYIKFKRKVKKLNK